MTGLQIVWVLCVVALMIAGQILFKLAAAGAGSSGNLLDTLPQLALNPYFIASLVTYGLTTLAWVFLLREVPLSRAYPFTAIALFLVPVIGVVLFREQFSWWLVGGGVLILAGVGLVARGL